MFLLFVHCSRVQTLGLRCYRGKSYFSDSTFLSMWAWISLVLMLSEILLVISPSSFFISPRAPRTTGIVSSSSKSYWFQFPDLFSWRTMLRIFQRHFFQMELLCQSACIFTSFLPLMTKSGLFACISLSAWIGISQVIVTTYQSSRFCNSCRSSNEYVLLTYCTRRCTLLFLIPIAWCNVVDEFFNYWYYF